MVEANVKWRNGMNTLVYAENYPELFHFLGQEDIVEVTAREVDIEQMKQGKEGRKKRA